MSPKKNLKTILRKNKPEIAHKPRLKKADPFDPKSFIFLTVALVIVIFVASRFFTNISREKENVSAIIELGVNDLNHGKIDEAEKIFNDALKIEKNNGEVFYKLAIIKYNRKQYEEAITDLEKIVQGDPTNENAYNILGNIHRDLGKIDEAIKNYSKAIQLKPKWATPYINLAMMFMDINKDEEAKKVVLDGLKNNPEDLDLENLKNILNI